MSLLKKFLDFLKINKKTEQINTEYFADYNPTNFGTETLTVEEMLGLSYITRSIQMIGNDVAKTTFAHYKSDAKKTTKHIQTNTVLHWMLNRKPNSEMNAYTFKKLIVWNLFLFGSAPIYCSYSFVNEKKKLVEMIPIYPEIVNQERDENGNLYYTININEDPLLLKKEEMIYLTYESIMNVNNVSLKALFKSTFNKLKENERAIFNAIKNDLGVSMIIDIPDITDKTSVDAVQKSVTEMIKMQKKMGSIAFVKDKRWSINDKASIIKSNIDYNTRNAIAREVAAMFGIPASKLGIEDNNKYNTMVERNRAYSDDAIKPLLNNITATLTDYFFEADMTQEISFKPIDLLSIDPNSLKDFASSAINNGWATPNEIRSLIGFEPVDEIGDELFANGAILPLKLNIQKAENELNPKEDNSKESDKDNEEDNKEDNIDKNSEKTL